MGVLLEKLDKLDSKSNKSLIGFLDSVLNHDVNQPVWEWEFNTIKDTVFTVAKDGDKVVGTQSMLPVTLFAQGTKYSTAKSETSYLSPDYRGQKIFEKLYALAVDETVANGTKFIWGFTPAVKAWKKNLNFHVYEESMSEVVAQVNSYKLSNIFNKSRNVFYGLAKYALINFDYIQRSSRIKKIFRTSSTYDVSNTLKNKDDISKLINSVKSNTLIYIDINEEYMAWRVKNNPAVKYHELYFYEGVQLAGYLVYSIQGSCISISDATFNLDLNVLKYMIKYVSRLNNDCHLVKYWGNADCDINKPIFRILEDSGGKIEKDKSRNFVYQVYDERLNKGDFSNMKNWYVNGLWTEGFHI